MLLLFIVLSLLSAEASFMDTAAVTTGRVAGVLSMRNGHLGMTAKCFME